MADLFVSFNPAQPAGQRLAPEVVAEIELVAPSTLNDGAVTEPKLAAGAVTNPKLAAGAVKSVNIAAGEVKTENLDDGAVTEGEIADGSVTPAKCAAGVFTTVDSDGEILDLQGMKTTQALYDAIASPSPNRCYFIVSES